MKPFNKSTQKQFLRGAFKFYLISLLLLYLMCPILIIFTINLLFSYSCFNTFTENRDFPKDLTFEKFDRYHFYRGF